MMSMSAALRVGSVVAAMRVVEMSRYGRRPNGVNQQAPRASEQAATVAALRRRTREEPRGVFIDYAKCKITAGSEK